jgi:uncharacterized protein (DUF433 family)
MSTASVYPHIVVEGGVARIHQTRYKVANLAAEHFHHGWTAEELLRQHPELRPEQVYAALTYFYDHYEEILASVQESALAAESSRDRHAMSRAELLRRGENSG